MRIFRTVPQATNQCQNKHIIIIIIPLTACRPTGATTILWQPLLLGALAAGRMLGVAFIIDCPEGRTCPGLDKHLS